MTWTVNEIVALISASLWPFFRIGAMFLLAPILGASYVPARVRLGLALVVTMVVVPLLPATPRVDPLSAAGLLITAQQVLTGLALGMALRLIFAVFELTGQVIAQHMALHFASMVDPNSGVQVPMISQFYMLLATLMFLSLNGHLVLIQGLAESFQVLPVGIEGLGREGLWHLVLQMGWVFDWSVRIALPAVVALLIVNLSFGVMTRAAPQLNIFAIGFPVTLLLGFGIIFVSLPNVVQGMEAMFDGAMGFARQLAARAW